MKVLYLIIALTVGIGFPTQGAEPPTVSTWTLIVQQRDKLMWQPKREETGYRSRRACLIEGEMVLDTRAWEIFEEIIIGNQAENPAYRAGPSELRAAKAQSVFELRYFCIEVQTPVLRASTFAFTRYLSTRQPFRWNTRPSIWTFPFRGRF